MSKNKKGVNDISNKTLAALLTIAILISLGGTLFMMQQPGMVTITGAVTETDTGSVSATIESVTAINLTNGTIDWGTGRVANGYSMCTLDSFDGSTTGCTNFSAQYEGFIIENIGNQNVSLNVTSTQGGYGFIGGSNATYLWKITNGTEQGSCLNRTGENSPDFEVFMDGEYYSIMSGTNEACPWFLAEDGSDQLELNIQLGIPADAGAGALSDTITFTAVTI